jgi:hypothetical protein
MTREIEFLVLGEPKPAGGSGFTVGGRCLGGPILIGDIFLQVRHGQEADPARLVVEEISAYGKLLAQLDPVVTAELFLTGVSPALLSDHCILSGLSGESQVASSPSD